MKVERRPEAIEEETYYRVRFDPAVAGGVLRRCGPGQHRHGRHRDDHHRR